MKKLHFLSGFLLLVIQTVAQASMVTIEFSIDLTKKLDYTSYQYVDFAPIYGQYGALTFDSDLTSMRKRTLLSDNINRGSVSIFGEGQPLSFLSPIADLTAPNPISGAAVRRTGSVSGGVSYSLLPPTYQEVSFAQSIGASIGYSSERLKYPNSYEGLRWNRNIGISGPLEYVGYMDQQALENYRFSEDELLTYFRNMMASGGVFQFSDGYSYTEYPTKLSGGYIWSGSARITNIITEASNEIPEPGTLAVLGAGMLALGLARRQIKPTKFI